MTILGWIIRKIEKAKEKRQEKYRKMISEAQARKKAQEEANRKYAERVLAQRRDQAVAEAKRKLGKARRSYPSPGPREPLKGIELFLEDPREEISKKDTRGQHLGYFHVSGNYIDAVRRKQMDMTTSEFFDRYDAD